MPSTLDKSKILQVTLVDENGESGGITIGSVTVDAVASATAPTFTEGETAPLSIDLNGGLRISGGGGGGGGGDTNVTEIGGTAVDTNTGAASGGTQRVVLATNQPAVPVTGTFWQATQPVSGTFWQATQPVSVSSLPLPSGAATATNQTSANTKLDTLIAAVDTLETLIGTTNTTLTAVAASLDDIETVAESTAPTLVTRAPYTVARPITPGVNVTAGQGVLIVCTVAGTQTLELSSGNTISIAVDVGTSFIDNIAVIDAPAGGTATCAVTVLAVS